MGMFVSRSGASVCKVYMSAVAGGNGEGRLAVELMLVVIMGVCAEGDVVLCVGGPQCLVVTDGKCRFADNDECVLAMRHVPTYTDED